MMKIYTAISCLMLLLIVVSPVAAQTPTPPVTWEDAAASLPAIEPYDYTPRESPLDNILPFSIVWDAIRAAYTVYLTVANNPSFPVLIGIFIAAMAMTIIYRIQNKPPDV